MVESDHVYAIESADGKRLLYEADTLEGILLAAAEIHIDYPGEEFVVMKGGEYDGAATLLAQTGFAA